MKRLNVIVHGTVQGVFFRVHAQGEAHKLGLKGFVKNLPDGSVEVIAEGEELKLADFQGWLMKGHAPANVEKVDVKYSDATNEFDKFEIRY